MTAPVPTCPRLRKKIIFFRNLFPQVRNQLQWFLSIPFNGFASFHRIFFGTPVVFENYHLYFIYMLLANFCEVPNVWEFFRDSAKSGWNHSRTVEISRKISPPAVGGLKKSWCQYRYQHQAFFRLILAKNPLNLGILGTLLMYRSNSPNPEKTEKNAKNRKKRNGKKVGQLLAQLLEKTEKTEKNRRIFPNTLSNVLEILATYFFKL